MDNDDIEPDEEFVEDVEGKRERLLEGMEAEAKHLLVRLEQGDIDPEKVPDLVWEGVIDLGSKVQAAIGMMQNDPRVEDEEAEVMDEIGQLCDQALDRLVGFAIMLQVAAERSFEED